MRRSGRGRGGEGEEGRGGGERSGERGGEGEGGERRGGGEARAWQAIASVSIREEPDRGRRERRLASEGALASEGGGLSL
jgi:hypothetical protein